MPSDWTINHRGIDQRRHISNCDSSSRPQKIQNILIKMPGVKKESTSGNKARGDTHVSPRAILAGSHRDVTAGRSDRVSRSLASELRVRHCLEYNHSFHARQLNRKILRVDRGQIDLSHCYLGRSVDSLPVSELFLLFRAAERRRRRRQETGAERASAYRC